MRRFENLVFQTDDAVQFGLFSFSLDGAAPAVIGVDKPCGNTSRSFHCRDVRQFGHFMLDAGRRGFNEPDGNVAAQHLVELRVHQDRDRVTPERTGDHDRHRHGNAENGQPGTQRSAFHGAQNHAKRRGEPVLQAPALNQHRFVQTGSGRAHGFGGGQLHGGPNSVERSQHGRRHGNADRRQNQHRFDAVAQLRKAEHIGINPHEPVPQRGPQGQTQGQSQHHNDQHQFQIVQTNGPVLVAQRLQGGDLFTLRRNLPAEHDIEQKPGHGQENAGQHRAQHPLLLDLGVENHVRHLLIAAMGASPAVGCE